MAVPWKSVRVFISSTFRDMQAERDWLVRFVFPKLREALVKYRIHFVDVDLRWGVTSDQDALGVCREVIDECHPRFVGILGGRYGWQPNEGANSITADEVRYGVLEREAETRGRAFFYFRDDAATAQMVEETPGVFREPAGSAAAGKLTALKQAIVAAGLPVFVYPAQWDSAQRRLAGLETFGNRVHDDLLHSLQSDPGLAAWFTGESGAPGDEFAGEAEQIEAFIEERTERYVIGSREPLRREMIAFADADRAPAMLVLTGDAGSGKSAFLADFTRQLTGRRSGNQHAPFVIPHFIGASVGSTDLRRTLGRLCHELARAAGRAEPLPLDITELIIHFHQLLAAAAGRQRIVLVFDALDQFDATDDAHGLNWLPRDLPPGVCLVVSTLEHHPVRRALEQRGGAVRVVKLAPLTEADTIAVIEGYLRRYAKRLSPEQLAALLGKPAGRLPLYILTALEELRTLGTYEEITARIRELPGDARALFGWILAERLARDPGFRDRDGQPCGAALVEKFAACLGVSRHGLAPAELAAVLDPGDPLGHVAALLRLLRPYLMRRGELLDFYHGQFREAARDTWLDTAERQRAAHQSVATCLQAFADPHRDGRCRDATPHALRELPHHQTGAEAWPDLITTLENLFFLEAKITHGMAFDLAEDFTAAVNALPSGRVERARLLEEGVRRDLHFVAGHARDFPPALFQCLWNSAWWYDCAEAAARYLAPAGGWRQPPAWENPDAAAKLSTLLERWRSEREAAHPRFAWVRALHPPSLRLGSGQLAVLRGRGHWRSCRVDSVAFSPDGRRILSGSLDQTATLWDALSGRELVVLRGHENAVSCVAFSPDGLRVVTGSSDGEIRLWDAEKASELAVLRGHAIGVSGVAFSPDGRRVVSGAVDKTMRLWDVESGQELAVLQQQESLINGVAFSPDGGRVVCGLDDDTARVCDARSGRELVILRGHEGAVRSVAFSPDGCRVVSGSLDKTVRLWDAQSGQELAILRGHVEIVLGVAFSPDGHHVLSGAMDNTLRLWDAESGRELAILRGHENWVSSVAFSPDGRRALSGSYDNTVRLWDVRGGPPPGVVRGHESWVSAVAFSPDGRLMVSVAGDYEERDNTLRLWDVPSGRNLAVLRGHRSWVNGVAFSLDGRQLLSGSGDAGMEDNTVRLWDVQTGRELLVLGGHDGPVDGVAFSPDGCRLLSRSNGTVRLWDAQRGRELPGLKEYAYKVICTAFSPDSRRLLTGSRDRTVRVWDVLSGRQVAIMRGHQKTVTCVAFSPDGRRALSGSYDGTVRLWDAQTRRERGVFPGHEYGIGSVAFSPDGLEVFSNEGEYDHTVRRWDARTGDCLEVMRGHGDLAAIAAGAPRFPWRALARDSETILAAATGGPPVAWYPEAFDTIFTHPQGRAWAGRIINRLVMLRLEGGKDG